MSKPRKDKASVIRRAIRKLRRRKDGRYKKRSRADKMLGLRPRT